MAVPRRKTSRSKKRMRRANHDRMDAPAMAICSRCGSVKSPHRVCLSCGFYKSKQVVFMKNEETEGVE